MIDARIILSTSTEAVIENLETKGLPVLAGALVKLQDEATEDWQRILIDLATKLIATHGTRGLEILESHVEQLLEGKPVDISELGMEDASNLLAVMQRREADQKNAVALYTETIVREIGKALGTLLDSLVAALFAGLV